jgi:alpha/beta superfamily hydrolase
MHEDFGSYAKSTNSNSYINIICHPPKYVMGTREAFLYNAKYNLMKKHFPTNLFLQD